MVDDLFSSKPILILITNYLIISHQAESREYPRETGGEDCPDRPNNLVGPDHRQ